MTKKERMQAVTERLKQVYPEAVCALHYTHDYELLFATRLSAQCTDARVNIVTEKLFSDFPTLESFAEASEEEIAEDIRSCGLFRTKARDLHACAMVLLAEYGGRVPDTMEELLRLNVKIIQISYPYWERNFYMATLKDRYLPPVVQRFKQFVITHCRV